VLDAVEAGDGAEAERAMLDHLEHVRDSIIAKLARR
jgi:DNA-binding GntR family transcriptional regulator